MRRSYTVTFPLSCPWILLSLGHTWVFLAQKSPFLLISGSNPLGTTPLVSLLLPKKPKSLFLLRLIKPFCSAGGAHVHTHVPAWYLLSLSNICSKWETFTLVGCKEIRTLVLLLHRVGILLDSMILRGPFQLRIMELTLPTQDILWSYFVRLVHCGYPSKPLGSFNEESNIWGLTGKPLLIHICQVPRMLFASCLGNCILVSLISCN